MKDISISKSNLDEADIKTEHQKSKKITLSDLKKLRKHFAKAGRRRRITAESLETQQQKELKDSKNRKIFRTQRKKAKAKNTE